MMRKASLGFEHEMTIMSHLLNCPAAWVAHLFLRMLAQYNLLASWPRINTLLILPWESPVFSMTLLLTHLGAYGLSVQPRSGQMQAKGVWLSSFCSKVVRRRLLNLLQRLWRWAGQLPLEMT